jgi:hypothetical protein
MWPRLTPKTPLLAFNKDKGMKARRAGERGHHAKLSSVTGVAVVVICVENYGGGAMWARMERS